MRELSVGHRGACKSTVVTKKGLRGRGTLECTNFGVVGEQFAVRQSVGIVIDVENQHPLNSVSAGEVTLYCPEQDGYFDKSMGEVHDLKLGPQDCQQLFIPLKVRADVVDCKHLPREKKILLVQFAPDLPEGYRVLMEITVAIPVKPFIRHLMKLPPLKVLVWGPAKTARSSIVNLVATTFNLTGAGNSFVLRPAVPVGGSDTKSHTRQLRDHVMPTVEKESNLTLTDCWGLEMERDVWPPEFFREVLIGNVSDGTSVDDVLAGEFVQAEKGQTGPELVLISINEKTAANEDMMKSIHKFIEIAKDPALNKHVMILLTQIDEGEGAEELRKNPSMYSEGVKEVCKKVSRDSGLPLNMIFPVVCYTVEEEKTPELELAAMNLVWHMFHTCGKAHLYEE